MDLILVKQPEAKIILLGILPQDRENKKKVQMTNAIIAYFNDDKRVFFLDMSNKFQRSPGYQIEGLFKNDNCHLTKKGYQLWYDTMEPLFAKLLAK